MKNNLYMVLKVFDLLRPKLDELGYVLRRESSELPSTTKIAVSDSKKNLEVGNKVVLIFSKDLGGDNFGIEHHYIYCGNNHILEDDDSFYRQNKSSLFATREREKIIYAKFTDDPSQVEELINNIVEYFKRVRILDNRWHLSE